MGYEQYLQALARMERPRVWWPVVSIALEMDCDRRLVSAYMTRLHKMGLAKRRRYNGTGRGRPGYAYRLSARGRRHARWLQEGHETDILTELLAMLPKGGSPPKWTPEMDLLARRFLRRRQRHFDHFIWVDALTRTRAKCLGRPWEAFDWDWWKRPTKTRRR